MLSKKWQKQKILRAKTLHRCLIEYWLVYQKQYEHSLIFKQAAKAANTTFYFSFGAMKGQNIKMKRK